MALLREGQPIPEHLLPPPKEKDKGKGAKQGAAAAAAGKKE
jgi:hypothetical protein